MKRYSALSIAFLCSVGLTSCLFKQENQNQHLAAADVEENKTDSHAAVSDDTNRLGLRLGKVHYFDEVIQRHTGTLDPFESLTNGKQYSNVVIDFFAPWCGPCKTLGKLLEEIAPKNNSVLIVKVDIDQYPHIAQKFNIQSIPTVLFFKNGTLVKKLKGFDKKEMIRSIKEIF